MDAVKEDMKTVGVTEVEARDCGRWRQMVHGGDLRVNSRSHNERHEETTTITHDDR